MLSKSEEKSGKQKTYTESYSITAKFITSSNDTVFASQVECVKLSATESKKPYRISEIKTLPAEKEGVGGASYKNIKYQCWEYVDNSILKMILKGNLSKSLDYDECISCSQIIAMLICESSRNPASYFTAPMVLDLIEYWINNYKSLITDMERLFNIEYTIDTIRSGKYIHEKHWNERGTPPLDYFINEKNTYLDTKPTSYAFFKVFYLKTELAELQDVEKKSNIISIFINSLFPMTEQGAVSVSRHITNLLNENFDNDKVAVKHYYDLGIPSTGKKLIDFINQEKILATLWHQCHPDVSLNALTQEWFGIDLKEQFTLTPVDLLGVDEIPF